MLKAVGQRSIANSSPKVHAQDHGSTSRGRQEGDSEGDQGEPAPKGNHELIHVGECVLFLPFVCTGRGTPYTWPPITGAGSRCQNMNSGHELSIQAATTHATKFRTRSTTTRGENHIHSRRNTLPSISLSC